MTVNIILTINDAHSINTEKTGINDRTTALSYHIKPLTIATYVYGFIPRKVYQSLIVFENVNPTRKGNIQVANFWH